MREFSDDELPGEPNHASLVRDAVLTTMDMLPLEYRGGDSDAFNMVWRVGKFATEEGLSPDEARQLAELDIREFILKNNIQVEEIKPELVSTGRSL